MSITVRNAQLTLGGKPLLKDLSICFKTKQLTMILGPNGTGKSSLLKVINDELPYKGKVSFYDQPSRNWHKPKLAQSVAVLPQNSSLSFNFTVQEVVELGGLTLTASQAEIHRIALYNMQRTDVAHLANRLYPSLSGGEQQRVHLARVLTQVAQADQHYPTMLMLDEPTAALDIAHQHHTLKLLKQLVAEGAGVIAVIHDLNLAAQYADRVLLLDQGVIQADGPPAEVLTASRIAEVYQHSVQIMSHPQQHYPVILDNSA